MHTQFDEYADNKTLLINGEAEAAVVDFEQTPAMPDGEAEGYGANGSETRDDRGEGEGISSELLLPQALSPSEGSDPSTQDDADEADVDNAEYEDGATAEATSESAPSDSSTDDSGDEGDEPQPCRRMPLPSDIDWRDLKPRAYGKSLPPLAPVERQNLEKSIVSQGVLGKILVDEWLDIIEGNTRWEICVEKGIVPEVEVISGLSEEEKEELAISCNLDRRQLKNPDVERQVLEARFDNMLDLRRKAPKKYPLKRIAATLGVSVATVSARERFRHNSADETVSKPDARRKYDEDIEREAVRLVMEGMPKADVARELLMHPKAVERAVNKEKKRKAGKSTAETDKNANVSTAQDVKEAITANDGIPRPHRLGLERIGQNPQAYVEWLEAASAKASTAVDAAADSVEELLKLCLYGSQSAAAANLRLVQLLNIPSEVADAEMPPGHFCPDSGGCKAGDILQGSVIAIEPEEVIVALSDGNGGIGVIDNRDNCLAWKGELVQGQLVRVRVEGFDSDRDLANITLLGRQSFSHAECASAFGPRLDNLCSPGTELAGLKAGPKEKEVIE